MSNPVHLLSVAGLLLVSFLVGAIIGSLARRLALRQKPAAVAVLPSAAVEAAPLVAAPVIAPLPVAPTPVAPETDKVPVPDFAATLNALAVGASQPAAVSVEPAIPVAVPPVAASMQPAHVAGETTSGISVAAPQDDAVPDVSLPSADVIPFPSTDAAADPGAPAEADDAPRVVLGADREDRVGIEDMFLFVSPDTPVAEEQEAAVVTATPVVAPVAAEPIIVPVPAEQPSPVLSVSPEPASEPAQLDSPEPVVGVAATPAEDEPAPERETAVEAVATQPLEPEPDTSPVREQEDATVDDELDESAAMRAIEGSWTPRRRPANPASRPVTLPEGANQAVAASARAVAEARRTAEAVVAESKVEAGRPVGLDGPRDGRKDDLAHIIGVLPVIETALNQLGIYHFDQVSGLTDENVGWIEGHLGIPGRIVRELWREQARELAAVLKPKRAAES